MADIKLPGVIRVWRYMRENAVDDQWTGMIPELREATGLSEGNVSHAIGRMLDLGTLERVQRGMFGSVSIFKILGPEPKELRRQDLLSDERKTKIRRLFESGMGGKLIARSLNMTPGSVAGAITRMGLRRNTEVPAKRPPPALVAKPPLVERPAWSKPNAETLQLAREAREEATQKPRVVTRPMLPAPVVAPPPITPKPPAYLHPMLVDFRAPSSRAPLPTLAPRTGRIIKCQFPTKEGVHGIGWEFCDDPSEPGRSYCENHCRACYVNWRKAA